MGEVVEVKDEAILVKEFTDVYKMVFGEDGTIQPCGRKVCSQLIEAASALPESYRGNVVYFGNPDTGVMHVLNLKRVGERVMTS